MCSGRQRTISSSVAEKTASESCESPKIRSTLMFSTPASREVDYQGEEIDLGIYINNVGAFQKGIYTVDAYTTQALLGHGELLLR